MLRHRRNWVLGVTLWALSCFPGQAFVLQGPHVLELMADKLGRARSLAVNQQLTIYDVEQQAPLQSFPEMLRMTLPDQHRFDIGTPSLQRTYVSASGRSVTIMDGQLQTTTADRMARYTDMLMYGSRQLYQSYLNRYGVDAAVCSLGRLGDRTAFVVGAIYPDRRTSQLWVDQQTLRPFRWLVVDYAGQRGDVLEFRYLNWQKAQAIWYPMRIEIYLNDQLVRQVAAQKVRLNPDMEQSLFDVERLELLYSRMQPEAAPQSANEENEVQRTIQEFKKLFE